MKSITHTRIALVHTIICLQGTKNQRKTRLNIKPGYAIKS
jgi:hypothetical protein